MSISIFKKFMFSQKLKELRLNRNLSQKEIAEILGISIQAYSRWETGKFSPNLNSLEKIADSLNVPITSLVLDDIHLEEVLNSNYIFYRQTPLSESQMIQIKEAIKDKIDEL